MNEENYLLDKRIKIYQPDAAYHASSDAVWLAAAVKKVKNGDNILDVGAGTGAVSLCLAERFKSFSLDIKGIEIQKTLVESANRSAAANGFDFVSFINADIIKAPFTPCSFAHVITNPPYGSEEPVSPNTSKALAHHFTDKTLKQWIDFCLKMLQPQGYFYMVNRAEALADILALLKDRLGGIEIFSLYSKEGQPAKRIVIRARKDSKKPLTLYPAILVHHTNGSYTEAAEKVLREGLSLYDILK